MDSGHILEVSARSQIPGHAMYRDWALPGRPFSYIALTELCAKLLPGRTPALIAFADICCKPNRWNGSDDFSGPRFEAADPRYPGLLVKDMPNPCQLPYRMVDGRRRLEKMRKQGAATAYFHVFSYAEVQPYIHDFRVVTK